MRKLLPLLLLCAAHAGAAEVGGYVELHGGVSELDLSLNDFTALDDGSITQANFDKRGNTFGITGGYQINPYFGVEAGFNSLGEAKLNATSNGLGSVYAAGSATLTLDAYSISAGIVGTAPVSEKVDLFARGGYIKIDATAELKNGGSTFSIDADDSNAYFGLGVRYNIQPRLGYSIEYTRFETDLSAIRLGLKYSF